MTRRVRKRCAHVHGQCHLTHACIAIMGNEENCRIRVGEGAEREIWGPACYPTPAKSARPDQNPSEVSLHFLQTTVHANVMRAESDSILLLISYCRVHRLIPSIRAAFSANVRRMTSRSMSSSDCPSAMVILGWSRAPAGSLREDGPVGSWSL